MACVSWVMVVLSCITFTPDNTITTGTVTIVVDLQTACFALIVNVVNFEGCHFLFACMTTPLASLKSRLKDLSSKSSVWLIISKLKDMVRNNGLNSTSNKRRRQILVTTTL